MAGRETKHQNHLTVVSHPQSNGQRSGQGGTETGREGSSKQLAVPLVRTRASLFGWAMGDVTHLPISSIERPLLPVSSTTGTPISRDRRRNDVSRSSTNAADGKVSIRVIIHCVLAIPRCKSLVPVCGWHDDETVKSLASVNNSTISFCSGDL